MKYLNILMTTKNMKSVIAIAFMFLFTLGAWADPTVTIIKKLNGETVTTTSPDNATSNISEGVCTLTVTPVSGNYVTSEFITVCSTVTGDMAQARRKAPGLDISTIAVTPTNASADPSGTTTYTFTMPADGSNAEVTIDFQSRKSVTENMITLSSTSFTYNGSAQSPTVTVKDGSTTLTENTHYTVSIESKGASTTAIGADTYDVVVTGIGIYTSSASKKFTISAKSITEDMVTLSAFSFEYNGEIQYLTITLKDGSTDLTENDFSYNCEQNGEEVDGPVEVGSYDLVIYGIGNYGGEITKTVTVTPKAVTPTVTLATTSYTYDGTPKKPAVSKVTVPGFGDQEEPIELEEGDYTVFYTDSINAGEATATVYLKGNFSGSGSATYTIAPKSIANVTIADIANQTYTGSGLTPVVTVTDGTNTLVLNTDYTVGYSNNTDAALATANEAPTVTITGKGNYDSDTHATKTFTILPAASTITAQNTSTTYNGYAQAYSGATVDKGEVVITYYGSEEARTAGSGGTTDAPTDATTYYVQVTQGSTNYSATPVNVTFTINPATVTEVTLAQAAFNYTGNEQTATIQSVKAGDLVLSANDYTISGNKATTVGVHTVTVTGTGNFTGSVTADYTISRPLDITYAEGQEWASYYATENLTVPTGLRAFIVTAVDKTTGEVTTEVVDYMPANQAVLLEKGSSTQTSSGFVAAPYTGTATEVTGNMLSGSANGVAVSSITDGTVFVLYNNVFKRATSGTIPANRAYLVVSGTSLSRLAIFHDDLYYTGINNIYAADTDGDWYSIDGRKLNGTPQRAGLYIKSGKKIFIK